MPEQDPIPPRRSARRNAAGEDDEVPPWANLPPVRPVRPERRDHPPRRDVPPRRDQAPRHDQPPRLDQLPQPPRYEQPPRYDPPARPDPSVPSAPDAAAVPPRLPRVIGARARRGLLRKRRRSFVMIGAAVVAVGVVLAVVFLPRGNSQSANISSGFISTFQPGELTQVPNACDVVPAVTVQQYLPGKIKQAAPLPVNGKLGSACNWTLDHQPVYRLLELNMLAYSPNGLASGTGSATFAAMDAYATTLARLQDPPKNSVGGKATVTTLSGLGNEAFSAMQVFRVGGATSDQATVIIRFHNVLVTVELSGLEHSNKGHYGPVDKSQLATAALAFAQAAYASLH